MNDFTEFLMTYAWAILAAVIAIAVLVVYGVFSPNQGPEEYFGNLTFDGEMEVLEKSYLRLVIECDGDAENQTFIELNYGKSQVKEIGNSIFILTYNKTNNITYGEFCDIMENLRGGLGNE